jgi:hypothetical protein
MVVQATLEAFCWDVKDHIFEGGRARGGKKANVMNGLEGREVMTQDFD